MSNRRWTGRGRARDDELRARRPHEACSRLDDRREPLGVHERDLAQVEHDLAAALERAVQICAHGIRRWRGRRRRVTATISTEPSA